MPLVEEIPVSIISVLTPTIFPVFFFKPKRHKLCNSVISCRYFDLLVSPTNSLGSIGVHNDDNYKNKNLTTFIYSMRTFNSKLNNTN